jgi:hypothetical protein
MVFPINHPQAILLISQQDQLIDFRRQIFLKKDRSGIALLSSHAASFGPCYRSVYWLRSRLAKR